MYNYYEINSRQLFCWGFVFAWIRFILTLSPLNEIMDYSNTALWILTNNRLWYFLPVLLRNSIISIFVFKQSRPSSGSKLFENVIWILYSRLLLCVSYPSVTKFSAILFLLFAWSSSNSLWSFQRFRRTLRRNFNWIRQQMKNFPIYPHCKNCPLSATL